MKVKLSLDENYPCVCIDPHYGREYEIPEDLWNKFVKLHDEFGNVENQVLELIRTQDLKR